MDPGLLTIIHKGTYILAFKSKLGKSSKHLNTTNSKTEKKHTPPSCIGPCGCPGGQEVQPQHLREGECIQLELLQWLAVVELCPGGGAVGYSHRLLHTEVARLSVKAWGGGESIRCLIKCCAMKSSNA